MTAACEPSTGALQRNSQHVEIFRRELGSSSEIYLPGTDPFDRATTRWSNLELPNINLVVVPGTESDLAIAIKLANEHEIPYLAYNGAHGATTTLGKMTHGIEIYLEKLSGVNVSDDGKTATILGGTNTKVVQDKLWEAGKQTVTGTCECVSYLGPALGGGHGWLQGRHGLMADQWVSMNVILADGSLETIDADSELMWAMKGAGHNFGIVSSVTTKIYDIEYRDWAISTFTFSGDKVEQVYKVTNECLINKGDQAVDVIHWSYWLNNPEADPEKPVIIFYLIQEGVTSVDRKHSQPLHDIGPISVEQLAGNYNDVSAWTGISLNDPPCQKAGLVNPRFPIYLDEFNVGALRDAYDSYAEATGGSSPFNQSLFMFEGYSNQGVRAVETASTAFPYRDANVLAAPLITYAPNGAELDKRAADLGNQLRETLHKATGRQNYRAYVNYAYGNENNVQLYGDDEWRQCKLRALKKAYDPRGKFSFYHPVNV